MRTSVMVVLFLAIAPFAGCIGAGSVQDIPAPEWRAGYAWSWNTTGVVRESVKVRADGEPPVEQSEETPVKPIQEVIEVLNTTVKVDGTPVFLLGYYSSARQTSGGQQCVNIDNSYGGGNNMYSYCGPSQSAVTLTSWRKEDLAEIPLAYSHHNDCVSEGNCRYVLDGVNAAAPGPEHPFLSFPLTSGKSWGGPLSHGPAGDDELEWVYEARVDGAKKVQTELGSVDTVKIDYSKRPVNLEEYKTAVVAEARSEGVDVSSFDYDVSWRRTVFYSEELQTIAKVVFEFSERISASGSDEGRSFQFEGSTQRAFTTIITGAQLFNKAERDFGFIARILAGEIALADPSGSLPDPRRVEVSIESDVTAVNAAADEDPATFTARVKVSGGDANASANDTGLSVKWTIFDYRQHAVAQAEGIVYGHVTFAQPGMYAVQADVLDAAGKVVASTQMPFEAYYERTFDVSRTVSLPFFQQPERVAFPVTPGIHSLEVTATPVGLGSQFNFNRLQVFDASDESVSGSGSGSTRHVMVTDFTPYFVNENPWGFRWINQGTMVADNAEVLVVQRYSTAALEAAQDPGSGISLLDDWRPASPEPGLVSS